jgi:hypothetical protein
VRALGVVCIVAATLTAVALPGLCADVVAWGPTVNRVRLGISFGPASSELELRVFLENLGKMTQQILIGGQVGKGTAVNFKFIATTPDGKRREGFEINSFTPIAALVVPAVIRLDPGATYELHFPLKNIICVEKPGDVTFEALVKQRSSIRISLETDHKDAKWAGISSPWIGKVDSGELSPLK